MMYKGMKKPAMLFAGLLAGLFCALAAPAFAASAAETASGGSGVVRAAASSGSGAGYGSLSITYAPDGTPAEGVQYALYRVAQPDGNGGFALVWTDAASQIDIGGADWETVLTEGNAAALIEAVNAYAEAQGIPADAAAETDADGVAAFTGLPDGLYLVKAESSRIGTATYVPMDFMVSLPYNGNRVLAASAKFSVVPDPSDDPSGGGGGGGGEVPGITALTPPGEVLGAVRVPELPAETPEVLGASRGGQTSDTAILANVLILSAAMCCFVLLWLAGRRKGKR